MGRYFDDEITHHGAKGQRWGIRRFQNLDGSLTPEGRLRYGVGKGRDGGMSKIGKVKYKADKVRDKIQTYKKIKKRKEALKKARETKARKKQEAIAAEKKRQELEQQLNARKREISKDAITLNNNIQEARDLFTNEEFSNIRNRLNEESLVADLAIKKREETKKKIDTIVNYSRTAINVIEQAEKWYGLYNKYTKGKNKKQSQSNNINKAKKAIEDVINKANKAKNSNDANQAKKAAEKANDAVNNVLKEYEVLSDPTRLLEDKKKR